jgi:hypothetical protein
MTRPRSSTTSTESSAGGRRWCCRRGSHPGIETGRSFALHGFIDERVAPIDRLRLVPDDRHGDGPRHTRALERPNGRPTHVMHEGTGTTSGLAGVLPRGAEVADPNAMDHQFTLVAPRQVEVAHQGVTRIVIVPVAFVVHTRPFVVRTALAIFTRITPIECQTSPLLAWVLLFGLSVKTPWQFLRGLVQGGAEAPGRFAAAFRTWSRGNLGAGL